MSSRLVLYDRAVLKLAQDTMGFTLKDRPQEAISFT